jgi:predicted permease
MSRRDDELDDEIRQHLRMAAEDRGVEAARREFGNVTLIKEVTREMWGWTSLERFAQDLRYAFRCMRRSPAFTLTAVLSLALGIGANTAIFTLIDALLLRSLPVHEPQRLVQLITYQNGKPIDSFSYPAVGALADQKDLFSALAGFSGARFNIGRADSVERTPGGWVSGEYYQMLGLQPAAGRLIAPADDKPGAPPVSVITDDYWRRKFAGDPRVVGQTILIESVPVTIVGVSPPGFSGANVGDVADITLPLSANAQLFPEMTGRLTGSALWLRILARPRPGISMAQLKARLQVIWPQLINVAADPRLPPPIRKTLLTSNLDAIPGATGWAYLRTQFRRPLLILMAVVGMVLLIACANVANLLLARAQARRREISIRLAVGASRARVIRQLLTESVLLASIGAAVALALAGFTSRLLVRLLSTWRGAAHLDLTPDSRVLAFTAALALATGVVFGIAPALFATAARPNSRTRLNSALVAAQVAVSFVLLVGAGLFVRTFKNLDHIDPGFRHEGVLLVESDLRHGLTPARLAFYRDALQQIEQLPGVVSASMASNTPLSGGWATVPAGVNGQSPSGETVHVYTVAPKFFETMRTPLLAGRDFTDRDDKSSAGVAIVNQAFVARFLPAGYPLGQRVSLARIADTAVPIVGVATDAISQSLREPAPPTVYLPLYRCQAGFPVFAVHAAGSLTRVASELRRLLQPGMPGAAIQIHTMTAQVEAAMVQERLMATLGAGFGALALTLAAIGLYGLLAYTVARRTSELGIRMALGASSASLIWLIIRHALRLLVFGLLAGALAAIATSRWIASLLFGLTATDPSTIVIAAAVLLGAGLLAGYPPARRASRIDPMSCLRCE